MWNSLFQCKRNGSTFGRNHKFGIHWSHVHEKCRVLYSVPHLWWCLCAVSSMALIPSSNGDKWGQGSHRLEFSTPFSSGGRLISPIGITAIFHIKQSQCQAASHRFCGLCHIASHGIRADQTPTNKTSMSQTFNMNKSPGANQELLLKSNVTGSMSGRWQAPHFKVPPDGGYLSFPEAPLGNSINHTESLES
jgi:hypothetical protein